MSVREAFRSLGRYCERLMERLPGGSNAFFDSSIFPWAPNLESNWRAIRGELDQVLVQRASIPNFQDVSVEQAKLTTDDQWKTFFFYAYGHRVDDNCNRCPNTAKLLRKIPGMKTAMFSILGPGKHIPEHRGPYKGVLRYHLGLMVPEPKRSSRIRVRDEIRAWEEGKSMVFDDSYVHEAWNESEGIRVVLFLDIVRPLPFPVSLLNRFILLLISTSEPVKKAAANMRHSAAAHG